MSGPRLVLLLGVLAASPASAGDPPVTALAITPDRQSLLLGSQAGLTERSLATLNPTRNVPTQLLHVHDLAFAPNGRTLAAAGGRPGDRGTIELIRWPAGSLIASIPLGRDVVYCVSWSADGSSIVAACGDGSVAIVSPAEQKHRTLLGHSRGVLAARFLPGDAELISAGLDDTIRVWNAAAGSITLTFDQHTQPVTGLAVRPGAGPAEFASIGRDMTVRFWQPHRNRMVRFARLPSVPGAIAWTADGKSAVVACHDGRLRVVDPATAEIVADLPGISGVAHALVISPDGRAILAGERGQVRDVVLSQKP